MQTPDNIPFFAELAIQGTAALYRLIALPSSRTFWLFLAVSLVIAVIVRWFEHRGGARLPARLDVFSKETWLGRSAMNDYWIVLINAILFGGVLIALSPNAGAITSYIADGLRRLIPEFAAQPAPWAPVALAAALFVADDFARYASHWGEHRIPALWELHKVHHSAEVLNFITAERHHPLSLLYYNFVIGTVAAGVNAVFVWAFAASLTPISLLGANAFWIVGNLLASSLRHSPVWLSFGPGVERWLISPAQHQIHHSEDERHFGKNLGSTLAIWDRLFGTLYLTTPKRIPLSFGLGAETVALRSVPALYWRPVAQALAGIARALGPRDLRENR